jgi:hypothetical protein
MRVPVRWVVALGLTLQATGCLPRTSQSLSLGPSAQTDLMTAASDRSEGARTPEQPVAGSSKKKWILIGAGAAVLIVVIILIAGGDSKYHPVTDQLAPIR